MIDVKAITAPKIKSWLVKISGKGILDLFDIKSIKGNKQNKKVMITVKPELMNHPFKIFIALCHNRSHKLNGKVTIKNTDTIFGVSTHRIASQNGFYKRLRAEVYELVKEIQFMKNYGRFRELYGLEELEHDMKKRSFRYCSRDNNKNDSDHRGIFEYVTKDISETPYNMHMPEISFDIDKGEVGGYVDGTKSCQKLYNSVINYVCNYMFFMSDKPTYHIEPIVINDATIHDTIHHVLQQDKKNTSNK